MQITETQSGIRLDFVRDFDSKQIFECGQAFRFDFDGEGYAGVAFGKAVRVRQSGNTVFLDGASYEDYHTVWADYFDLDRDYGEIKQYLSRDDVVRKAIAHGGGIRILRQQTWETLVSFIISQNNNIPRIKKIISSLCSELGEAVETPLESKDGRGFFSFPSAGRLAEMSEQDFAFARCGFRVPYIRDAAEKVASGEVDFSLLDSMSYQEAKGYLQKIKGVGPKVADCVLLFGAGRLDAFPIDVWIRRVISEFYGGDCFDPVIFAPYGGIAQQYLFHYARGMKIAGMK